MCKQFGVKTIKPVSLKQPLICYERLQAFFKRDNVFSVVLFILTSLLLHICFIVLIQHLSYKEPVLVNPDNDASRKVSVTLKPTQTTTKSEPNTSVNKRKDKKTLIDSFFAVASQQICR